MLVKVKVIYKYLRSFLSNERTVSGYPLSVREQSDSNETIPKYCAQIVNSWAAAGLGGTPSEAIANLQRFLTDYKKHKADPRVQGPKSRWSLHRAKALRRIGILQKNSLPKCSVSPKGVCLANRLHQH